MSKNLVRKIFSATGIFAVPAGVTKLRAIGDNLVQNRIALDGYHSHAIDSAGAMWSWGENTSGQLGNGTSTDVGSTPLLVVGGIAWRSVHVPQGSIAQVYGIDVDGQLWAWGANGGFSGNGLLGTGSGTTVAYSSPVLVAGSKRWTQVLSLGGISSDAYGIDSQGQLWHWGYAANNGMPPQPVVSTPLLVTAANKWKFIADSPGFSLVWAIDKDDNLWSINHGGTGFLTSNAISYDQQFPGPFDSSGGGYGTGDSNPATTSSTPVMVTGGQKWTKILSGITVIDQFFGIPWAPTYIGLTKNGEVRGWGFAHFGPVNTSAGFVVATGLSFAGPAVVSIPTLVVGLPADKRFVDIATTCNGSAAVPSSYFALAENGDLYAWGNNTAGVCGVGNTNPVSSATLVLGGHKFSKLFTARPNSGQNGQDQIYALDTSGALWAWGYNDSGKLGTGSPIDNVSSPQLVIGGQRWSELVLCAANWERTLGINTLGDLYQWGEVYSGSGFYTTTTAPTIVVGSHRPNPRIVQEELVLTVKPGQEVPIEMSGVYASIGSIPFAKLPSRIIVEYEI